MLVRRLVAQRDALDELVRQAPHRDEVAAQRRRRHRLDAAQAGRLELLAQLGRRAGQHQVADVGEERTDPHLAGGGRRAAGPHGEQVGDVGTDLAALPDQLDLRVGGRGPAAERADDLVGHDELGDRR